MNCLHILSSEYPPDIGGVADYTGQVAGALARAGEEVHVWTSAERETSEASGVRVHPDLGRFRPSNLRRLGARLDEFPSPRRILVQWVPHGYGYRSMNLWFCLWLAARARGGDRIELMVHEPFLQLQLGPLRHICMALVHRVMTMVLMGAASRVWVAIPAWESKLRPYTFARRVRIEWLPIPGCVVAQSEGLRPPLREQFARSTQALIGHFGTYGRGVVTLLEQRLPAILDGPSRPALLLIGAGSSVFRATLVARRPEWAERIHATGYVPSEDLARHLAACDVFVQPYPDGVTSRRTSVMAALAVGRAVVTTAGHLTESLWKDRDPVALVDIQDRAGFAAVVARLLDDAEERRRLAARGQDLFRERFTLDHVVSTLRAA
jgi:glycosyltransferase involved in cell wall biosynthesis